MVTHVRVSSAVLATSVLALLAGCNMSLGNRHVAEESAAKTFTVKSAPQISVDTFNGSIQVAVASADKVEAKVTKVTHGSSEDAAEEDLKNIEVSMTEENGTIRIQVREKTQR